MQKEDYLNNWCQKTMIASSYCTALSDQAFDMSELTAALIYVNAAFQSYIAYQYTLMGCEEDLSKVSAVQLLDEHYKDYYIGIHPYVVRLVKTIDSCINLFCKGISNITIIGKTLHLLAVTQKWLEYLLQMTDLRPINGHTYFIACWDGKNSVNIVSQLQALDSENT